jgi:RNA polymerase sigma-70 factor (sigma-E family)
MMAAMAFVASPFGGAGDRDEALTCIYRAEYRRLVRLACLLLDDRGAGEETVQEAFIRLHRHWARVQDAPAYLRSTVLNLARSRLRRRLVARKHQPTPRPNAVSAEAHAVLSEDQREVIAALRGLPRRQRECLVLRYYLELSEAEIASTLGISAGSVKSHTHRGLAALAAKLDGPQ